MSYMTTIEEDILGMAKNHMPQSTGEAKQMLEIEATPKHNNAGNLFWAALRVIQWQFSQIETLQARVAELEANIIEADAQYNIDKKPSDIHSAELALVRMASMGAEAISKLTEPVTYDSGGVKFCRVCGTGLDVEDERQD